MDGSMLLIENSSIIVIRHKPEKSVINNIYFPVSFLGTLHRQNIVYKQKLFSNFTYSRMMVKNVFK